MQIATKLPWYFSMAKRMIRSDTRGGWRAMAALERAGLLSQACRVPFLENSSLVVPLDWRWYWTYGELKEYEPNTLRLFGQAINRNGSQDVLFLDCGAHIGLVSHFVAHACKGVQRAFAFEPNKSLFPILAENCRALPNLTTPMPIALSSFTGRARLIVDGVDADGSYIEPDSGGAIEVTTVDELGMHPDSAVAMKIDVEGSELPILRGALKTLSVASGFVVLFEAHKHVMERSGYDPLDCVRFLNSIRKCSCLVTGQPDLKLDLDRPFFAQVGAHIKRDVLVYSDGSRLA